MERQYTVAVLSDIHSNIAALDAVLADLATQPHDETVIAGDLMLHGCFPAEVLDRLRPLNFPTVYGNTDLYVARGDNNRDVRWTREQIGAGGVAYLQSLPFERRVTPPGGVSPDDDLLIVHATPTNVQGVIITEPHPLRKRKVPTPEEEAVALLGGVRANLIVYGHIHYASEGVVRGPRLASVNSVGLPLDGDHRAAYALISWDGDDWHPTHHRVPYDHEAVAQAFERTDAPFAAYGAAELRAALPAPKMRGAA